MIQSGFDTSPERLENLARFFRGGEAKVEVVQTYASGDLVVQVHRHADALVHGIDLAQLGALARGDAWGPAA